MESVVGACKLISPVDKKKQYDCSFITVESVRSLLLVLHKIFGYDSTQSRKHLPYDLPQSEEHLYWKEHDLDIAFIQTSEKTQLVYATTGNKSTLKKMKQVRKFLEVDSRKVYRAAYFKRAEKEYLDDYDKKIGVVITRIGLLATLWLIMGLPNEFRFELLLLSATIALIFEYAKMIKAVDIRLMLWGSFWYFVYVAIPAGVIYCIGIIVPISFSYVPNPFEFAFFSLLALSMIIILLSFFVASLRGSIVGRKIDGLRDYLTPNHVPGALVIGLNYLRIDSQSFLVFLALLSGLSLGIRITWNLSGLYLIAGIGSLLIFVPFFIYSALKLYRCLMGDVFRQQLVPMIRDLQDYVVIVEKIAEEGARRKRFGI